MMKGFRSIIKIAAFLLILGFLLYGINGALEPKYTLANSEWPTTSTFRSFYTMEKDSVDVLFLGSSFCVNGFIPQEIYNQYGIRSYNLGSEQQSVLLSYYWLEEALRFQKPSVVVLEGHYLQNVHPESPINTTEGLVRKSLDPMRLSKVKYDAVRAVCALDERQETASWYLTNIRFHDRWKSLGEIDFDNGESMYSPLKGWAPGNEGPITYTIPVADDGGEEIADLSPLMVEYFCRMADLCREKGIRLVVMDVPYVMSAEVYRAYKKLCSEQGADYIELGTEEAWNAMGVELPRENTFGHGNIWGNIKISRYAGKILSERYGVAGREDAQYEESKPFYEHFLSTARLKEMAGSEAPDADEYLSLLKDSRFTVFVAMGPETVSALPEAVQGRLSDLGFSRWEAGTKYLGILTDDGITEETGDELWVSGRFRGKNSTYDIKNFGSGDGAYCMMTIDDEEFKFSPEGLSILVYDSVTHQKWVTCISTP